jgi:uncharacterized repeat protein (TIGR04076 family)
MAKKREVLKRGIWVLGRVLSIRGHCRYGHEVGDEYRLSCMDTGGLCPDLYRFLYPYIMTYQFGGKFPDDWSWAGNRLEFLCPDVINGLRIQLRPENVEFSRHELYLRDENKEE